MNLSEEMAENDLAIDEIDEEGTPDAISLDLLCKRNA